MAGTSAAKLSRFDLCARGRAVRLNKPGKPDGLDMQRIRKLWGCVTPLSLGLTPTPTQKGKG